MNKKLKSILSIAGVFLVAFVLFMISRHNIKTAEKNNDIFAENLVELLKIVDEIVEENREGGMPQTLTFVRENKSRAMKAVENLRAVCDYFEKVTVPGALKSELAAVRAGIPDMRRFLDKYEDMFHEVMLESEFMGYVHEMTEGVSTLEEDGNFIIAEQEFMREMKRLTRRKGGLMWL